MNNTKKEKDNVPKEKKTKEKEIKKVKIGKHGCMTCF